MDTMTTNRWKIVAIVGVAIALLGGFWWRAAASTEEANPAEREAIKRQFEERYLRDIERGEVDSGPVYLYPEDQVGPLTDE
jgi:hypothetical protein